MTSTLMWSALVPLASILAVALYGWDKRAARLHARRVPERTLHLVSLLGGWPGAWLAQLAFRHKTAKPAFQRLFWLTVALHVAVSSWLWFG
jgi:uncharacterized membrane protein YsdA (DUF1294 family)